YDPGHAYGFDDLGEAYAPLRGLVEELADRQYAGRVYAFRSGASFNLTTAPNSREVAGQEVGIEYDPARGLFEVGYLEWSPPGRRGGHRGAEVRVCGPDEVGGVIDGHVGRMLPAPTAVEPDMSAPEKVMVLVALLGIVLWVGSIVFGYFHALLFGEFGEP